MGDVKVKCEASTLGLLHPANLVWTSFPLKEVVPILSKGKQPHQRPKMTYFCVTILQLSTLITLKTFCLPQENGTWLDAGRILWCLQNKCCKMLRWSVVSGQWEDETSDFLGMRLETLLSQQATNVQIFLGCSSVYIRVRSNWGWSWQYFTTKSP